MRKKTSNYLQKYSFLSVQNRIILIPFLVSQSTYKIWKSRPSFTKKPWLIINMLLAQYPMESWASNFLFKWHPKEKIIPMICVVLWRENVRTQALALLFLLGLMILLSFHCSLLSLVIHPNLKLMDFCSNRKGIPNLQIYSSQTNRHPSTVQFSFPLFFFFFFLLGLLQNWRLFFYRLPPLSWWKPSTINLNQKKGKRRKRRREKRGCFFSPIFTLFRPW